VVWRQTRDRGFESRSKPLCTNANSAWHPPWSDNEYQRTLQGVNGHITSCTSPAFVVSRLQRLSGWGLHETEISVAVWIHEARERLYCL